MAEQVYVPALIGLFYTGPTLAYIIRKFQSGIYRRRARYIWERWETSSPTSIDNDLCIEVMTSESLSDMLLEFKRLAATASVGRIDVEIQQ